MIRDGHLTAFYLFEVADAVALDRVAGILGQAASPAKLSPKPATPAYVQYQQPPLTFDGAVFDAPEIRGLRVRVRVYDYGVISIALSRPFAGAWPGLIARGSGWSAGRQPVARLCLEATSQLRTSMVKPPGAVK